MTALNRVNLPVVIGTIGAEERARFSDLTNSQVFDMPIYMPKQGWKIPEELSSYRDALVRIAAAESLANPAMAECNAYVTVDCGVVHPQGFARRGGLHVDGFLTSANAKLDRNRILWGDNTYIVSDSSELQTELYPGPFNLESINKDDPQAVLRAFADQGQGMAYQQANPYDIVRLTTNNVHAVHPNLTLLYLARCFLKVTFSERLFNRSGNTINPNLYYRFQYVPRTNQRNTQNFIGSAPEGYQEVDLRDIDFGGIRFPAWLHAPSVFARKKEDVRVIATPAREGETLTTEVGGDVITTNVARAGDMKITRVNAPDKKDSYFLGANFRFLYAPTDENDVYKPTYPASLRPLW